MPLAPPVRQANTPKLPYTPNILKNKNSCGFRKAEYIGIEKNCASIFT